MVDLRYLLYLSFPLLPQLLSPTSQAKYFTSTRSLIVFREKLVSTAMEPCKHLVLTHDFQAVVRNVQLNTRIELFDTKTKEKVFLDLDRWNELKHNMESIEKEFYARFNYQYSDL